MLKINHDVEPGKLDYCQITGSKNLFEIIDLGHQPPCDALLTSETVDGPEVNYPLRLMLCPESGLAQLDYIVEGKIIYPADYPYRAGISKPLQDYLRTFGGEMVKKFNLPTKSLCIDIGCNDGTLLTGFKDCGMKALGVEPTDMAKFARQKNKIEVIQSFFTEAIAKNIVKKHGQAKIITMTNVFAHMAPLGEVMRGITKLLDKDGIFMAEIQYLLDIFERNQFDQVYHEHIRLYSVKSLVKLFSYYEMEVFDAQRMPSREGSIRVYAARRGSRKISSEVKRLLAEEERKKLFKPESWVRWRKDVEESRYRLMKLAYEVKKQGKLLVADSCPGRGAVLVNYYGIDKSLMPYISQLPGSEKIGKYLPGTNIPIVDNKRILKDKPDYIVILAWHYADYIIKNWRAKGLKSKFILPLPKFRIIS